MTEDLSSAIRRWKVGWYERTRHQRLKAQDSVALGFAWPAPNTGGVRRHLECIEKYSSFPVVLYPSSYASQKLGNGVDRSFYNAGLGKELVKRHALFHSHVDPGFVRLSRIAQAQGKPWVHTYHSLYFAEDWDDHLAPWQIEINDCLVKEARQADVCLAVGSWLVDWLKTNHGIESRFVPNGVDVEACNRAQGGRFTREFGIDDFVLFVGSIAQVKNPFAYIEIASRFPDRAFVMIGTGLTSRSIKQTNGIEISSNIKLLGPLSHKVTLDAIAACRAIVMTSHREGLPTVLLEAMAMGKPCVVPEAPWFADAIPSDQYGLRYLPGDLDDLADKIETSLRRGTQPAARERVEQKFAWPMVVRQLDQIYRELLG
jgi:glycosyltransferase involved in cell wall biosynthesis